MLAHTKVQVANPYGGIEVAREPHLGNWNYLLQQNKKQGKGVWLP